MSIEGSTNTFDFTAVEDVVDGLILAMQAASEGEILPPIHFVSGRGTTLRELAEMAATHAMGAVEMIEMPGRNFDVASFIGDPSRARELLGWRTSFDLKSRVSQLVADLAAAR